ncbi:MAG: M42 family peptidase [Clostridia bacterium]|nr:M42 family peptidase [Clostridia bacterium]MBR6702582.1 M42 family peptidase [Clostridia bacterium]
MLEILKNLCNLPGISGRENKVRDYIISKIDGYCEYKIDPLGNLIVFKKGAKAPKNKIMLDAHTDEVGMIVTGVDSDGFIKFANVGGVETAVIIGRNVRIGEKNIPGVLGIKPIHLIEKDEEQNLPKKDDLYIDIGAKSKEEALSLVSPGEEIHFESEFIEFGDGFIKSKALDDRAGCAVMIDLIRSELEYDCWFSFSVQEEIGTRGAAASAFTVNPDYAIVLETTTAADISGVKGEARVCVCGSGGAISFMDRATVYDLDLYRKALGVARANNIKAQTKTRVAGGNDAGAIHKSRGGVKVLTISVPTRYLHSPCCVCKYEDIESVRDLAKAMITELAQ